MFKFQFIGKVNYVYVDITVFANSRKEALGKVQDALETKYDFNDDRIIVSEIEVEHDPSEIAKAKAEAIKEFAEKIKEELDDFYYSNEDALLETADLIDNLVKEMTEGKQ